MKKKQKNFYLLEELEQKVNECKILLDLDNTKLFNIAIWHFTNLNQKDKIDIVTKFISRNFEDDQDNS